MDLLKAEIARKRKATADLISEVNPDGKIGDTRYVRQSDVIEARLRQQLEAQEELDRKRQKVGDSVANDLPADGGAISNATVTTAATDSQYATLSTGDIKRRLRLMGHPITLFGENNQERIARLRSLELNTSEEDDFRLTSGHTNVARSNGHSSGATAEREDEDDDDDEGGAKGKGGGSELPEEPRPFEITHFARDASLPKRKVIYKYFRFLLKCWEWDLSQRADHEKLTAKGKVETKTQKQCKDYIRYLFKLCKKDEVPPDIELKLFLLVGHCEDGDFRAAHDEYLQAAIGKAAWPIGLTMVGIHERSGRERISTSKVAHVMNNEAQRKYFTSVKRLMTYAQKKRTDIPPSMKVF